MAKNRDLNPVEQRLAQWAQEALDGPIIPDFDPEFSAVYSNLWMLLTWRHVGDLERSPGSLSVAIDGSAWRVSYYDPSAKRRCAVVAPTLLGALKALDTAVVSPDTVWSGGKPRNASFRKRKDA